MYRTLMRMPLSKLLDMADWLDIASPSHKAFKNVHSYKQFIVKKLLWINMYEELPLKDVTGKWRVSIP